MLLCVYGAAVAGYFVSCIRRRGTETVGMLAEW